MRTLTILALLCLEALARPATQGTDIGEVYLELRARDPGGNVTL